MKFNIQNPKFCKFLLLTVVLFFTSCRDNMEDILTNKFWVETYYNQRYHTEQKFAIFFGANHKFCSFYNYQGEWKPYIIGLSDEKSPERIEDCIGEWSIINDSCLVLYRASFKILDLNKDSLFIINNYEENKDTVKYYRSNKSPIDKLPE